MGSEMCIRDSLRTIHSFDPCIACAVHVIDGETNQVHEFKVL
mgnify:CR=1 FL=1